MKQIDKDHLEKKIEEESTQLTEQMEDFYYKLEDMKACTNRDHNKIKYLTRANSKKFAKKKEYLRQLKESYLSKRDGNYIRILQSKHPVWLEQFELVEEDFVRSIVFIDRNSFFLRCELSSDTLKKIKIFFNVSSGPLLVDLNGNDFEFIKEDWDIISDYLFLDFHFNKDSMLTFKHNIKSDKKNRFKKLDLISLLTRHRKFAIELISHWYPLDEGMLAKYCNNLDWTYISINPNIKWSVEAFEKYIDRINWFYFSGNIGFPWTSSFIEKYDKHLIYHRFSDHSMGVYLSRNESIPWCEELIEKYKDEWDWESLGLNKRIPWSIDLIRKYSEFLSWDDLKCNRGVTNKKDIMMEFGLKEKKLTDIRECSVDLSKKSIEDLLPIKNEIDWNYLSYGGKLSWTIEFIETFLGYIEFGFVLKDRDGYITEETGLSTNEFIDWNTELLLKYEHKWNYEALMFNMSFINFFNESIYDDDLELILIN